MRKIVKSIIGIVASLAAPFMGHAENTVEYSVQVSANVQATPAQIALAWPQDSISTPKHYTVYRRTPGAASWGNGTVLPGTATTYVDKNVTTGVPYEYEIVKQANGYTGYGYIYSGINVPMTEGRGKLVLVVDNTYSYPLSAELTRLQQDLVGDGWTVSRLEVNRNDSPVHVKSLIKSQYNNDPANTKAVFLFGHVPVPYSGDIVPDGHYSNHQGAWPCDGFYADMDGTWTDNSVNDTTAEDVRNHNVPGDGKFDQSKFPAPLKLMVGRVDLANMPGRMSANGPATFPSELELLRNYLNKDHNFRNKVISAPERAIVGDYFGVRDGEAFAASGWRNFAPLFGADKVTTVSQEGAWIPTLHTNSYLFAYGCGSGSYTSIGGIGNVGQYRDGVTTELVNDDIKAVFTLLYGSWLGDWDSEDNIQRAVLATKDMGLTCAWSGRPHWFMHHMALGQPIGFSTRLTQNDGFTGLYKNQQNNCASWTHIALMGDPTLRMQIVAPAADVNVSATGRDANLNWTASADEVEGYNVYRATNPNGPFTRINGALVKDTSYADANGALGNYTYMVRAVKLEKSASGTYYNPSQGTFASLNSAMNVASSTRSSGRESAQTPVSGNQSRLTSAATNHLALGRNLRPTGANATDTLWFDDALPAGAQMSADGGDNWNWINSAPAPFSGNTAQQSAIASGEHGVYFQWAYSGSMTVNTGEVLFAYVYLDPANMPSEIMMQWFDANTGWNHRAYWGANSISFGVDGGTSRHYMGAMPAGGQWVRLEVPASAVGLEGGTLIGMSFNEYGGRATWDCTGKAPSLSSNTTSNGTSNTSTNSTSSTTTTNLTNLQAWVDDSLPSGAQPGSDGGDTWNWIGNSPSPQSGTVSHQSAIVAGEHQHFFNWAYNNPLVVNTGDVLYAYIYIDPANPPSEVMLQWFDSNTGWDHRAYWGANNLSWGTDGTISRRSMGALPAAGQWVQLQIPASQVGLEGSTIVGLSFSLYDGRATWDSAGKATASSTSGSTTSGSTGTTGSTGSTTPSTGGTTTTDTSGSTTTTPPTTSTNTTAVVTNAPSTVTTNPPAATNLLGSANADYLNLAVPSPGSYVLHVVTPTLLELKLIGTKDTSSSAVSVMDLVNSSYQFITPSTSLFAVTANGQAVGVSSVGFKRRALYAPLKERNLRIENALYLQLSSPLSDNQTVKVVNPNGALFGASTLFTATVDPLRYSPAIHVNQEGYMPNYAKKAMVAYYAGSMGEVTIPSASGFKLVDGSGNTVFTGTLTQRLDTGWQYSPAPYQKVYEADFSSFSTQGQYRLVVPGLGASLPFNITDGVAMDFARAYELGIYEQRCGAKMDLPTTRFTHDYCHTNPASVPLPASSYNFTWTTIANYAVQRNPDNPAQTQPSLTSDSASLFPFKNTGTIDTSGGHHDAGDYSKYTANVANVVHDLIFAVDSMPGVSNLDNLGIAESGDGIPDVLQEAKWEADYLAKLQDADGAFYFIVYPIDTEYESDVTPDHGHPQVVWPKNSVSTAAAVAALAQAGSSPVMKRYYPQAAANYLAKAKLGWTCLTNALAKYGWGNIYQRITFYGDDFADHDELAWAATEMFLATGDQTIHNTLKTWFPDPTDPATFRWGWWRLFACYGNAVRDYAFGAKSGRLPQSALDSTYLAKCITTITNAGNDAMTWSKQSAYGTSFPIATKNVQGAGWYFSSDQAFDISVAYQFNANPDYITAVIANMNYEGGCNPINVSYVTGLGWKRQRDIVSQWHMNDYHQLPPSGMPVGNVESGYSYISTYANDLPALSFPQDSGAGQTPFYERWGDSWNVQNEMVTPNSTRSLASIAWLAAQTSLQTQTWKPVQGTITVAQVGGSASGAVTCSLSAPGLDLSSARITWETRDIEPQFGSTFTFTPLNNDSQWVEAEAQFPDGRRVMARTTVTPKIPTVVWVDDDVPYGAQEAGDGGDPYWWNWVSSAPTAQAGWRAHQSAVASGVHQSQFYNAQAVMNVPVGATLYAYAYLDPANPPSEVMLQWRENGSNEHRAYWGANSVNAGTDGTISRKSMGALPATGQWVKLSVPASAVGLEGKRVDGMSYILYNGRATWDTAGLTDPSFTPATNVVSTTTNTTGSVTNTTGSVTNTTGSVTNTTGGSITNTTGGSITNTTGGSITNTTGGSVTNTTGGSITNTTGGSITNTTGGSITNTTGGSVTNTTGGSITNTTGGSVTNTTGGSVTNTTGGTVTNTTGGTVTNTVQTTLSVSATDASRLTMTPGAFTITRTGDTSSALTVSYTTSGTATAGTDYQALPGSVTIPAGATSATITLTPLASSSIQNAETLTLSVASSTSYSVSGGSATANISANIVPDTTLVKSGSTLISWNSIAGASYKVAYKNDPTATAWTFFTKTITASGTTASYSDGSAKHKVRTYLVIRVK